MIKLLEVYNVDVEVSVTISPEVFTYDILSSLMSDDSCAYGVASNAVIWLTDDGKFCEWECISPVMVTDPLCQLSEDRCKRQGFPAFQICVGDNISSVQLCEGGFWIWFAKGKEIDEEIMYKNVSFFLSKTEMVAVKVEDTEYEYYN